MSTTLILIAVAGVLAFGLSWWRQRRLRFYGAQFPGPLTLPVIGSGYLFFGGRRTIVRNIVHLATKYQSPWRIWLGSRLFFIITKPEDVEIVLNGSLHKPQGYEFAAPVIGEGLFTAQFDKWKRHRKVILTTFNQQILNGFVEVFAEHSQTLVDNLQEQLGRGFFDVYPYFTQCALEMICETAMGKGTHDGRQYVNNLAKGMELVYRRLLHFWYHPTVIWRSTKHSIRMDSISSYLTNFVQRIIDDKKIEYYNRRICDDVMVETSLKRKAFLDLLIELSEEGENWPDSELLEEAQTMIAAGSESVGSTESYTLLMLALHPHIQAQVYEELVEVLGDSDRVITHEDLSKMEMLERVIKETLRLFPVAAAIGRYLHEDVKIGSKLMPKGSTCIVGILQTHRQPDLWCEPNRFNPDRFLPEFCKERHPYSYLPFSAGPRNCIGMKYAMMAMKTIIANVLRNYRVSTNITSVDDIQFIPGIVIKSLGGYTVALERRFN